MTLTLHNTGNWTPERIQKYGPEITAAMHKFVARFPKDVTVEAMARDVFSGRQQLWLVMNGDEFRYFLLTEIKTNDATGVKSVMVTSLAGDDGLVSVPLISGIEDFARSHGATQMNIAGRMGWKRALADEGYSIEAVLYRKELS